MKYLESVFPSAQNASLSDCFPLNDIHLQQPILKNVMSDLPVMACTGNVGLHLKYIKELSGLYECLCNSPIA